MTLLDTLKPFIDWLYANPGLACLAILMISCAESLAIIGLFIPGSIVMPAIGSLVGAKVLPGSLVLSAAIIGAIIGDGVSYWLGYRYHEQIRGYWPFNRFPRVIKSGEQFFLKHGGLSVFIGRFVGPVRPIIPVVAGMMNMPPNRFLVANVLSAIAWAIVYMAPGFFLGAVSEQLAPHTAARLLVMLAIATFMAWLLWWLTKRLWRWVEARVQKTSHHCWQKMSQSRGCSYRVRQFLLFQSHPLSHKPLLIVLSALGSVLVFTVLLAILHTTVWFSKIDVPVYYVLRSFELPSVDHFMAALQAFGSLSTYGVVLAAISGLLVWRRRWRALCCWLGNFFSCWLIIDCVKASLHVPRPANNLMLFSTWSFPSLHGGLMMALLMGVVMLLLPHIHRRLWSRVMWLGFFLVFIAAIPQLYFGFNWLSDEMGGTLLAICIGSLWVLGYYRGDSTARLHPKPILWGVALSFVMAGLVVAKVDSDQFLKSLKVQAITVPVAMQDWWQGRALPIRLVREDAFGNPAELMTIQYVGHLSALEKSLRAEGWKVVPKPSLTIILNRIAAKDRLAQLPLIPDLYQAHKPLLIMTKIEHTPERLLVLRLWATTVVMVPIGQPLWLGTVQYRKPWHFGRELERNPLLHTVDTSAMSELAGDLTGFSVGWVNFSSPFFSVIEKAQWGQQQALFVRSIGL